MCRFNQQGGAECTENLSWSSEDLASGLHSLMKLKDFLQKEQLKGVFFLFLVALYFFRYLETLGYCNDNNILDLI